MWRRGNALAGLMWCLAATVGAPRAAAQEAPRADWTDGLRAYAVVRGWLDAGGVDAAEVPPPAMPVTGLFGVRVTLRMNGKTVGSGEAYREQVEAVMAPDGGPATDLTGLLREATAAAIDQVRQALGEAAFKSVLEGRLDPDAGPPTLTDVAHQLRVGVQLGYGLEPVRLRRDAPPGAVLGMFAPGYHGLRAPAADRSRLGGVVWPATALAGNVPPSSQVSAALAGAGHGPEAFNHAGRPGGVALQRFQVFHVVRSTSLEPPRRLIRGNVLLPPHGADDADVRTTADRLAAHLRGRFVGDGAVRGTFLPSPNRYAPMIAPPEQAALACYAMARHARIEMLTARAEVGVGVPGTLARSTALALADAQPEGGLSAAAGALILLTLVDAPQEAEGGRVAGVRAALTRRLLALRQADGAYRRDESPDAPAANLTTHALIAAALASAYELERDPAVGAAALALLDRVWSATARRPNIGSLYWQALAHSRVVGWMAGTMDEPTMRRVVEREAGMAAIADRLLEQQVVERPAFGPDDVLGGYVLQAGEPGAAPNPDWRTASVLAFIAVAVRDSGIARDRQPFGWLLSCSLAARFVSQLMMTPPSCYYVRSLDEALDGVRLALFDNALSVSAASMALLALVELQESTLRLNEAEAPPAPAPPDPAAPEATPADVPADGG